MAGLLFRHRVIPAFTPRMATQDALDRQPRPSDQTESSDSLMSIGRTRRMKFADTNGKKSGERAVIEGKRVLIERDERLTETPRKVFKHFFRERRWMFFAGPWADAVGAGGSWLLESFQKPLERLSEDR